MGIFLKIACVFGLEFGWRIVCRIVYFAAYENMNFWNEYSDGCKPKLQVYWLWPLMSQAEQWGLNHQPDRNKLEVEQVSDYISFFLNM